MCRAVPAQIPGVVFLSGGQTEQEATINLNAINLYAQQQKHKSWSLTFSFGRGLQVGAVLHAILAIGPIYNDFCALVCPFGFIGVKSLPLQLPFSGKTV